MSRSSFSFNVKSASGYTTKKIKVDKNGGEKELSKLVTTEIKKEVVPLVVSASVETIRGHNERVVYESAMFFQRVVTRTPKDETYYDPTTKTYHKADNDFVWEHWKIAYGRRSVTAKEMGAYLFEDEAKFNDPNCIKQVARIIKEKLFYGEAHFSKRATRIRGLRFENNHPRFALLEYGGYETDSTPKLGRESKTIRNGEPRVKGSKHWHGVQNGYSVQAPYGMLRITQAEMQSMQPEDFGKWLRDSSVMKDTTRVPSHEKMKKLVKFIGDRTHLNEKDIEAIVYEVNK